MVDSSVTGDFANNGTLANDPQPNDPDTDREDAETDDPAGRGELLDLATSDPEKCAKKIKALWEQQDPAAKRRKVIWDQHKLWLYGIRGIRARPVSTDVNRWELYVPPGALDMPPVLDQTESLLDKVTSHVLADQAKPEAIPVDDSPDERDGAQFAERWLEVMGSESGTNDNLLFRTQSKKSGIYGSGFIYHYIDQQGWEADKDAEGGRRHNTTVCKKGLPAYWVRPLPDTARDLADADGVLVMNRMTVGDIKRQFPWVVDGDDDHEAWSNEDWATVVDWKPPASKWALPWYVNARANKGPEFNDDGSPTDETNCVTLAVYYKVGGEYQDGCYILTAGATKVLYGEDWLDHSTPELPRPLDLPVVQVKQLTDDISDDFYGRGLVQMLGPIGEVRASIVLAWLDYLDRFTHPHTFLPLGSVIQPDQLAARDGRAIYFNPQAQPVMETVPPFPADAKEFLDRAGAVENDITGLYAAEGKGDSNVTSEDQLALQVSQAQMNVTQIADNLGDAIERSWRVSLQLARAFIPDGGTLAYEDEDGSYRQRAWKTLDFGNTAQVKIKSGTFTQMSQSARESRIANWQQIGWLQPAQAVELVQSGIRAETGLADNPFLRKIRRELSAWRKGPDQQWLDSAQEAEQHNALDSANAQITGSQPQPAPMPKGPFQRDPTDMEQDVAKIRHAEIRHEIARSMFSQQNPLWQQALVAEYMAMKQAAGVLTYAEQMDQAQKMQHSQEQAAILEKVAPVQAKAAGEEKKAVAEAEAGIQAELRKLAQEITLLREAAALKAGIPPASQVMQDTLLRDSALFSASGPNVPYAGDLIPGGLSAQGAPITPAPPSAPPAGGPLVGGPTGPRAGPEIPGGAGNA